MNEEVSQARTSPGMDVLHYGLGFVTGDWPWAVRSRFEPQFGQGLVPLPQRTDRLWVNSFQLNGYAGCIIHLSFFSVSLSAHLH
jgi:hypothetical protein